MVISSVVEAHREVSAAATSYRSYSDVEFNFTSISREESNYISNNASTKSTQNRRSNKRHAISEISTQHDLQMLFQSSESMGIMSPDPWADIIDYPMTEHGVLAPESPGCPTMHSPMMPLATSTDCEPSSYLLCVDGEELELPLSQKEETMCLANAHRQINQLYTLPSDHSYSNMNEFKLKSFDDSFEQSDDGFTTTTDNRFLYRDTMVSDASKVINFLDEDSNLEAIRCDQIFIKKEQDIDFDDNSIEHQAAIVTSTPVKAPNESASRINVLSGVAEKFEQRKSIEELDLVKSNKAKKSLIPKELEVCDPTQIPTLNKSTDNGLISRIKIKEEKPVEEKPKTSRMKHLRNELPAFIFTGTIPASQETINTPDLLDEMLNLQEESFDLINFVVENPQECGELIATPLPSPKSPEVFPPESPETDAASPAPSVPSSSTSVSKRKRSSVSFYENPSSVQSYQSSNDEPQPKRKRGRPPKTESTPPSPTLLKDMSAEDLRYYEMRNKNNEASRRSRLNRKQKEESMEHEAEMLGQQHKYLVETARRLKKKVEKLETMLKQAIQ